MLQSKVKILYNRKTAGNYYKLSFKSAEMARLASPGQFFEMQVPGGSLLRKPLGLHRITGTGDNMAIEVLYEIVGKGTQALAGKNSGEMLDVIGPLGNGFDVSGYRVKGSGYSILAAGGIGVAPLMALAQKLTARKTTVLIGGRTKSDILCEKEFKQFGCDVKISTDDGSAGYKGFVTDLLKKILTTNDQRPTTIYACGPKPMLKAAAYIAIKNKIPCQVLLEEYMACGVGVCLGCPVMTVDGYKMVCKDGPVFDAKEIIWE